MAGTSLNDLLYEFLKKITSATSGSTEDMAMLALLSAIDPTLVVPAADITFTPEGTISATDVQAAITELGSEKLAKVGDTLESVFEVISVDSSTAATYTLDLATNILLLDLAPTGASTELTMPTVPTTKSQSGILLITTTKVYTWAASPVIRWIDQTDADTTPTPAAAGYITRYTYQNMYTAGRGWFWGMTMAGKDTA